MNLDWQTILTIVTPVLMGQSGLGLLLYAWLQARQKAIETRIEEHGAEIERERADTRMLENSTQAIIEFTQQSLLSAKQDREEAQKQREYDAQARRESRRAVTLMAQGIQALAKASKEYREENRKALRVVNKNARTAAVQSAAIRQDLDSFHSTYRHDHQAAQAQHESNTSTLLRVLEQNTEAIRELTDYIKTQNGTKELTPNGIE